MSKKIKLKNSLIRKNPRKLLFKVYKIICKRNINNTEIRNWAKIAYHKTLMCKLKKINLKTSPNWILIWHQTQIMTVSVSLITKFQKNHTMLKQFEIVLWNSSKYNRNLKITTVKLKRSCMIVRAQDCIAAKNRN